MESVVVHLTLDSGWASEIREFGEEVVDQWAITVGLHTLDQCAGCLGQGRQLDCIQ
jgi:hypothetical protein